MANRMLSQIGAPTAAPGNETVVGEGMPAGQTPVTGLQQDDPNADAAQEIAGAQQALQDAAGLLNGQ